eukprot:350388-Chlamydomonas_euryale.AAC.15
MREGARAKSRTYCPHRQCSRVGLPGQQLPAQRPGTTQPALIGPPSSHPPIFSRREGCARLDKLPPPLMPALMPAEQTHARPLHTVHENTSRSKSWQPFLRDWRHLLTRSIIFSSNLIADLSATGNPVWPHNRSARKFGRSSVLLASELLAQPFGRALTMATCSHVLCPLRHGQSLHADDGLKL